MGQYIATDMQLKEPACSLYSFTSASRAATSPLIVADSAGGRFYGVDGSGYDGSCNYLVGSGIE
jgi:hypothetical protein